MTRIMIITSPADYDKDEKFSLPFSVYDNMHGNSNFRDMMFENLMSRHNYDP